MNSKRLHTALLAVLALLFIAMLGGTYGANKLLAAQADKLKAQKAKSQALDRERVSIEKAKQDIKKYSGLNKIAKAVVPQDKNQAEAVREIVNIAAANGVTLASVTFPASTLGNLPSGTPASAGSQAAKPAPSSSSPADKLSQLTAVKNIPGVYQLPITIKSDKNPVVYDRFISFLSDIEHNRRTAQVESITLSPDTNDSNLVTFELTLSEYIKP
jgi:Tfp pilus assembly protein PilO